MLMSSYKAAYDAAALTVPDLGGLRDARKKEMTPGAPAPANWIKPNPLFVSKFANRGRPRTKRIASSGRDDGAPPPKKMLTIHEDTRLEDDDVMMGASVTWPGIVGDRARNATAAVNRITKGSGRLPRGQVKTCSYPLHMRAPNEPVPAFVCMKCKRNVCEACVSKNPGYDPLFDDAFICHEYPNCRVGQASLVLPPALPPMMGESGTI